MRDPAFVLPVHEPVNKTAAMTGGLKTGGLTTFRRAEGAGLLAGLLSLMLAVQVTLAAASMVRVTDGVVVICTTNGMLAVSTSDSGGEPDTHGSAAPLCPYCIVGAVDAPTFGGKIDGPRVERWTKLAILATARIEPNAAYPAARSRAPPTQV